MPVRDRLDPPPPSYRIFAVFIFYITHLLYRLPSFCIYILFHYLNFSIISLCFCKTPPSYVKGWDKLNPPYFFYLLKSTTSDFSLIMQQRTFHIFFLSYFFYFHSTPVGAQYDNETLAFQCRYIQMYMEQIPILFLLFFRNSVCCAHLFVSLFFSGIMVHKRWGEGRKL